MKYLAILILLCHQTSGIIYSLNLTEYFKMPELYEMDDFDRCLTEPGGLYCIFDADVYPGDNPELMRTIQEYSEYKRKHFNHTKVHRALCVTKTCKDFIQSRNLEEEVDLELVLEECVNATLWREYKLNARTTNIITCKKHGAKRYFSTGDYIMAAVFIVLIILNALGTLHDELKGNTAGNPYLLAFSIRRNWRRLRAPSSAVSDHRLRRLKSVDAIRSLTIMCVFATHTALSIGFSYLKNPLYYETIYDDPVKNILIQGPLVTYTFFMLSGFLVAFNVQIQAERRKLTLWDWPKGILLRYLRLTPALALVMFTIMTLNRHLGDGPQWDLAVTSEAAACQQYWWAHLLYINNYVYDDNLCLPQGWYLAADTQLFVLGLLVCLLFRSARAQAIALGVLGVASLVMPAAHMYFQDLDAISYQSPEMFRTVYKDYDTFRTMYIGSHTNLSTYIVGLAGGLIAYHWFKTEKTVTEKYQVFFHIMDLIGGLHAGLYQKIGWAVKLYVPVGLAVILSGAFFYVDGYEPSMVTKVLSTLRKPVLQVLVLALLLGCIFKAEGVVRGVLEWSAFTWMARLSYSAFLIHTIIQRGLIGSQRLPTYATDIYLIMIWGGTAFLSNIGAAILWLSVEAPLATVVKNILAPAKKEPECVETGEETTKV